MHCFSNFKLLSYLLVFASLNLRISLNEDTLSNCTHPVKFLTGSISEEKNIYFKGEKISFKCKDNFLLFGDETVECLGDNKWSLPPCGTNVALKKQVSCLEDDWKYEQKNHYTSQLLDGNTSTCYNFTLNKMLRLTVNFLKQSNISNVDIYLRNNSALNISVKFPEVSSVKQCHRENTISTADNPNLFKFYCVDALKPNTADKMLVTFASSNIIEISLCEITAISYSDRRCGTPEVSRHCKINKSNKTENVVEYEPKSNYSAGEGNKIRNCVHGKWSGKPLVCTKAGQKITACGPPENPTNVTFKNDKINYKNEETVNIQCKDGFLLDGSTINQCNNGSWDDQQRYCDKNLMLGRYFWIETLFEKKIPCLENFTDGDFSTSSRLILNNQKSIFINLIEKYTIEMFILKISTNKTTKIKENLTVDVEIGNRSIGNQLQFQRISYNNDNWNDKIIKFNCSDNPCVGDIVRINFNNIGNSYNLSLDVWEFQAVTSSIVLQFSQQRCSIHENTGNCIVKEVLDFQGNLYLHFSPQHGYDITEQQLIPCNENYLVTSIPKCLKKEDETLGIAIISTCLGVVSLGILLFLVLIIRVNRLRKLPTKKNKSENRISMKNLEEMSNELYESFTSSSNQLIQKKPETIFNSNK